MRREHWVGAVAMALMMVAASAGVVGVRGGTGVRLLPKPVKSKMSVEEAIARRRSVRAFSPQPLSDSAIGALLFAAQGVTDSTVGLRAAPSAGATYPLVTYLLTAGRLERYLPERHALESLRDGDFRAELAGACLGQACVAEAPAVIVLTAIHERTRRRYGDRAVRYVAMEAGHAAQNVHLQAVSLGLGSVPVGAFDDSAVEKLLGCRAGERALYVIPVGLPRERAK